MTLWRAVVSVILLVLGPAWRRMLLGVFLAGVGYLAFLPAFEGRQEAAQIAALIEFSTSGRIALTQDETQILERLSHDGPWPAMLTGPGRAGYARSETGSESGPLEAEAARYRAHPLMLGLLAPARAVARDWSWPAQIRFYRLMIWSLAIVGLGLAVNEAVKSGYLDSRGGVIMAAWPFMFPQFFAQMTAVGGAGAMLACFGAASAALMVLSRRNELTASLGLGLALGLGIWADSLMLAVWCGLTAYLVWRGWRLHKEDRLDGEWLVLRVFSMGLALLIGSGWLIYAFTSAQDMAMTPVLGEGFGARLWSIIARFSGEGGASAILPGPGWRVLSLVLLVFILIRWEFHWRALPSIAKAPAFILPVFTLSVLLIGLQGHDAGLEELHVLAPMLALIVAVSCRSSALVLVLVALSLFGALGQGLFQASVFSSCAVFQPDLGRYGYEGATCLLNWPQLEQVSAPGFALKALGVGALSALSALYSVWRQASWQRND